MMGKRSFSGSFFFFFSAVFLSVILLASACGRRGDPVPIVPPDEPSLERGSGVDVGVRKAPSESPLESNDTDVEINEVDPLKPPGGLTGVFTRRVIVLSWDDVTGKDIHNYKVYRSSGDGYTSVGETGNSAFTDRNIELDREYYYRVSTVGETESPLSESIAIQTTTP